MLRSAIASLLSIACAVAPLAAQDTLVVRADGPPFWGEGLRLVEEVRIGALEGDPEATFGSVVAVLPVDGAQVWVGDGQAMALRRYDWDGRYLGDVGRVGDGPGEFKWVNDLSRMPDGRIAFWDYGNARMSVFAPDAAFDTSVVLDLGGVIAYAPDVFRVDTAGSVYVWNRGAPLDLNRPRGEETPLAWIVFDADGSFRDTVRVPRRDYEGPVVGGQSYGLGTMPSFGVRTFAALSPHGYQVSARADRYALHRPLRDGRVVRIERSWTPVPVEGGERDQFEAMVHHVVGLWGDAYGFSTDVPDTKPPFWALWVDDDARIWVARHVPARHRPETDAERAERERLAEIRGSMPPPMEWWEPVTLDVFEPNGRFLGTVVLPSAQSRPMAASGRTLWTVERGDFDEEYVVRWRIEGGG